MGSEVGALSSNKVGHPGGRLPSFGLFFPAWQTTHSLCTLALDLSLVFGLQGLIPRFLEEIFARISAVAPVPISRSMDESTAVVCNPLLESEVNQMVGQLGAAAPVTTVSFLEIYGDCPNHIVAVAQAALKRVLCDALHLCVSKAKTSSTSFKSLTAKARARASHCARKVDASPLWASLRFASSLTTPVLKHLDCAAS